MFGLLRVLSCSGLHLLSRAGMVCRNYERARWKLLACRGLFCGLQNSSACLCGDGVSATPVELAIVYFSRLSFPPPTLYADLEIIVFIGPHYSL